MEEAINSYTKAYLNEKSAAELKAHYYRFPGIDAENKAAQALLRIAIIGVFEEQSQKADKEKNEVVKLSADATIKVLFEDLKSDFEPKTLTNYILVRVGDYLREKTAAPRLGLPYYEEVVGRDDIFLPLPCALRHRGYSWWVGRCCRQPEGHRQSREDSRGRARVIRRRSGPSTGSAPSWPTKVIGRR